MKTDKNVSRFMAATAMLASLLCFLPLPVSGAQAPETLAEVQAGAGLVTFQPLISHSQVRVTVTGPDGFEVVKTFGADETPAVELPGTDGLYKYELRFAPVVDREARERLAAARAAGADDGGGDKATDKRTVQRGWFSLAAGSLVPDLAEPEPKVVLTNGDGVIRNSLCVGFDCPDAPLFDDSTILMMENNTRIKFGDTSNAPFPNNDWEIEANSNLSGGANYLGFNDCGTADNDGGCAADLVFAVESGARASALYVESDGDVGIGTSNPVVDLHLVTGNTPTLRLDQDGSSGFAPQVWDIAGNETNFFVRDVTSGSTLPFRIRPGAPTSSIDIAASGNIGIGTASPGTDVHIKGHNDADDHAELLLETAVTGQQWMWRANNATGEMNIVDNTGTVTTPFKIAADSNTNLLRLGNGATNRVDITGSLFINGVDNSNPDYVFGPEYELESIEEHARYMWENKHLPAVGRGVNNQDGKAVINVANRSQGMLEELEKAHIYIEQLHKTVQELQTQLAAVKELEARIEELERE